MRTTILKQCAQYAKWIWGNVETDTRNIGGDKYGIGNISHGSVIEWLTPLMPPAQLLGYLQGLHAAKNNPAIFDKTPFDDYAPRLSLRKTSLTPKQNRHDTDSNHLHCRMARPGTQGRKRHQVNNP